MKYLFDSNTQAYVKTDTCKESTTLVTVPNDKIPSACGRRFKAVITADVKISSNRYLVGTLDGLLFLWDGENAFNLGCCPNCSGEIRKLCYCEKTSTAYGIAGSENDICIIFSYDDKNGVKYMGRAHFCTDEGLFSSCNLSSIDVNQDGTRLAVGAYDEMGTVYDITL